MPPELFAAAECLRFDGEDSSEIGRHVSGLRLPDRRGRFAGPEPLRRALMLVTRTELERGRRPRSPSVSVFYVSILGLRKRKPLVYCSDG